MYGRKGKETGSPFLLGYNKVEFTDLERCKSNINIYFMWQDLEYSKARAHNIIMN